MRISLAVLPHSSRWRRLWLKRPAVHPLAGSIPAAVVWLGVVPQCRSWQSAGLMQVLFDSSTVKTPIIS